MKKITSQTVAEAAGVSHSTVSRVMNSDPRIGRETRMRVLQKARELGYDLMRRKSDWTVALIMPKPGQNKTPYFGNLLAALLGEIQQRGLHAELITEDGCLNERLVRGAIALCFSGAILRDWAENYNLPLVRINTAGDRASRIGSVEGDSYMGGRLAARHLFQSGHRRIGMISFRTQSYECNHPHGRWQGVLDAALAARNSSGNCRLVCTGVTRLADDLAALLSDGYSGLICVDGSYASLQVNRVLFELGISIPRDVSVVDWELPGISANLAPPRTAISYDSLQLAREALNMLEVMCKGSYCPANVVIAPRLIERASVAAIACHV